MSNNFINIASEKNCELETLGTRQRILQKLAEECSCARKHLVAF